MESADMSFRLVVFALILAGALPARVKTGLDVLVEQDFAPLAGKRVAVMANQNSVTWDHRNLLTLLAQSKKLKLTVIFAPEHGFSVEAPAGANIPSGKDASTGVPVYSLHDPTVHRPTPEMLRNVDAILYDLPEVGARFWTY